MKKPLPGRGLEGGAKVPERCFGVWINARFAACCGGSRRAGTFSATVSEEKSQGPAVDDVVGHFDAPGDSFGGEIVPDARTRVARDAEVDEEFADVEAQSALQTPSILNWLPCIAMEPLCRHWSIICFMCRRLKQV